MAIPIGIRMLACLAVLGTAGILNAQDAPVAVGVIDPTARPFEITYVAPDAVYLDGGSEAGLAEGHRLAVRRRPEGASLGEGQSVGEIVVFAVTRNSAVAEIISATTPLLPGDIAYLSTADRLAVETESAEATESEFAQVVTFSEGDPLEEEIRETRPRPPLPEVNRVRGRIGFEHSSVHDRGGVGGASYREGLYLRTDMTRIGGTHWNLTGYWRGRLNARTRDRQQETLTDLTNRVYHIGMYYTNPDSPYVLGFGRLLVPWANSLSTLDGGYFGRRLGDSVTLGGFGGSTPDPTAWNYDPDRQIFGGFLNIDTGSFETTHYTATAGVAATRRLGDPERRFVFFENNIQFGRTVSVYHNMEADHRSLGTFSTTEGPTLSRSFVTLRVRPHERVALDFNHNYFRLAPTFDPRLIGSGLIDDLLFEGLSGGVRVEAYPGVTLYTRIGRSERDEDASRTLNQMYGVTWSRLPGGLRAGARYSRFDGPFGTGDYRAVSLTYDRDTWRVDAEGGDQKFDSGFTGVNRARYVNVNLDWFLNNRFVWGGGASVYRGDQQDYDQIFFSIGYVFNSRRPGATD